MPTYDYACADCGAFEAVRRIAERDAACACPACGASARRLAVSAPHLAHLTWRYPQGHGYQRAGPPRAALFE